MKVAVIGMGKWCYRNFYNFNWGSGQYEELLEKFACGELIACGLDGLKNL